MSEDIKEQNNIEENNIINNSSDEDEDINYNKLKGKTDSNFKSSSCKFRINKG